MPNRKVSVGALAGAITVIAFYVASTVFHVSPPAEVAAAVTTVFTFAISYLVPEKASNP